MKKFYILTSCIFLLCSTVISAQCNDPLLIAPDCDFDGDGIINSRDLDDDNDGIPDFVENQCEFTVEGIGGTQVTAVPLVTGGSEAPYPFSGGVYYVNYSTSMSSATGTFVYNFTDTMSNIMYGFVNNDFRRRWFTDLSGNPIEIIPVNVNSETVVEYDATIGQWVWYDIDPSTFNVDNSANGVIQLVGDFDGVIMHYAPNQGSGGTDGAGGGFIGMSCNDLLDTDGDGFPNSLDLDSDDDGCPDAYETGISNSSTISIIAGPYGDNGQANSLESTDTFEPWIYELPLYELYTLGNSLNNCNDNDGDGYIDVLDIDDDNDGILDADESPSCYYTAAEQPMNGDRTDVPGFTISTDLKIMQPLKNAVNGINTNFENAQFVGGQGISGKSIIQLTFPYEVELTSARIVLSGTTTPWGNSHTHKLQASHDGLTWVDVSGNNTGMGPWPITMNQDRYKFYRIYGVTGSTIAGFWEIETTLNTATYEASHYPKPNCTDSDFDGDGIPNYLDLDSDNDGCPDALEGSNPNLVPGDLDTDTSLAGGEDPDGLPLIMNFNAQGVGSSQNVSAVDSSCAAPVCTDPTLMAANCDFDGDGISNADDIDDDNDGIVDALESPSCYYTQDELSMLNPKGSEMNWNFTNSFANITDGNTATFGQFTGTTQTMNGKVLMEFGLIGSPAPTFTSLELVMGAKQISNTASDMVKLQGFDGASWVDLSPFMAASVLNGSQIFNNTLQPSGTFEKIRLLGQGTAASAIIYEAKLNLGSGFVSSLYPKSSCSEDYDGDGIPNHLDLDSDNDGCPDIVEGGDPNATAANPQLPATPDANGDGLNDTVDTNADHISDYSSTYPYALSDFINLCADTDGDGINDIDDVDDDNDGILDSDESPDCYYSLAEVGTITKVSTLLTNDDGVGVDLPFMHDGVNTSVSTSNNVITSGQAVVGAVFYTVEYPLPIPLSSLTMYSTSWGGSATNPQGKLQGSNDLSTWTDLSPSTTVPSTNGAKVFNNTLDPSGTYQYYRIVKTNGINTAAITTWELEGVVNSTLYIPSLHPKQSCAEDFDGDGIYNHLDLDSDGDGCPDAIEGTDPTFNVSNLVSSTDFMLSGGTDLTGLPNQMNGVSQGIGTSQDPDAFDALCDPPFCSDPTLMASNCDFDGDGVNNGVDLDDDNDGVLDTEECIEGVPLSAFDNQFSVTEVLTGGTFTFTESPSSSQVYTGTYTNVDDNSVVDLIFIKINSNVFLPSTFEFSNPVTDFQTSLYDIDGAEYLEILAYNGTTPYVISASEYSYGSGVTDNGNMNFSSSGSSTSSFVVDNINRLDLHIKGPITKIVINKRETNTNDRNFSIENPKFCMERDTDGDGIPNAFDLDSDGDGCPDSKEAGVTGNLISGDVINGDGTSNTTTTTDSSVAEGPYGANGLANAVETDDTGTAQVTYTSTYDPNALDPAISSCVCYKFGTGPAVLSKVGISTRDRHVNQDLSHWPEDVPGGYLVLDSKEKPFVITRMTTAEIDAVPNPVEGMMAYDSTLDCLKLYDGEGWICIEQTCDQ